jgi:serine/threonine protein kinase
MDSSAASTTFHAPEVEELRQLFPAYELGDFIAKGGMGAVYSAQQKSLDRPVAIKILPKQFGADPQFRASFEAEAKAMAKLNHPNLIAVYDFGDADGMLYIIMELVEGKSLHHSSHGKSIEQAAAAGIISAICRGLDHAHQAGILHRDIKPGNILLDPNAVPKIGDFGLARPVGEAHNPEEIIWGTPGYTAPEVLESPHTVDQRADIFSVGVLFYELLTAQIPSTPWQQPSSLSICDPQFDTIIRRATHPSPGMRYANASEMADELDAVVKRLAGGAPNLFSAAGSPPHSSAAPHPIQPTLASTKPKSGLMIAAAIVALLAIAGVIIGLSSNKNPSASSPTADLVPDSATEDPKEQPIPIAKNKTPIENPKINLPPKPEPVSPPPEPIKAETPLDTLARLRPNLSKGNYTELPEGTLNRDGSHFFLVSTPLTWLRASHFAEAHGAQLAVLEMKDALNWILEAFDLKSPHWLGLSDSGTESKWHWANGTALSSDLWAPGQPDDSPDKEDGEDFAALLPGPALEDLPASRELPFLLQWHESGQQPGSLRQQIKRTATAFKDKKIPIFPTGTHNVGGSRFLIVPESLSWDEASALATTAGGHLAVPSSPAEGNWMLKSMQSHPSDHDGLWVGASLSAPPEQRWTFVTAERFEFVNWAPGQPDLKDSSQPVLQIRKKPDGGFGYHNSGRAIGQAGALLLEWSAPSRRNMPGKKNSRGPADIKEWLATLRQKTVAAEKASFERYQRSHEKNLKDFLDDVEKETETARRFSKEAADYIDSFMKEIENGGEIPSDLGSERARRFIGNLHEKALAKQTKLWEDYQGEFQAAKTRYLAELKSELARRTQQRDKEAMSYLKRELSAASNDPYFREILSGGNPAAPDLDESP